MTCFAEKMEGTFTLPENEKYLCIDWDFSETVFEKKFDEKEWQSMIGKEEWENAKKEALSQIILHINTKMKKSRIIAVKSKSDLKSNYTLYIAPISLDKKGNNKSKYILKNSVTDEVVGEMIAKGDGGHWGDLANLLWDGYEEMSEKIAKKLVRDNKL